MSWEKNTYDKLRQNSQPSFNRSQGGASGPFEAMKTQDKADNAAQASRRNMTPPVRVEFPSHLYIPEGAQNIDLRRLATIPAATVNDVIMRFKCPAGAITRFIGYAIFNDGALASDFSFLPNVDGARVFPYHGDPLDNYRISLGLAPDFGSNSVIPCQLALMPEQEIVWYVSNASAVAVDMGVRMIGYFDSTQRLTTPSFGG